MLVTLPAMGACCLGVNTAMVQVCQAFADAMLGQQGRTMNERLRYTSGITPWPGVLVARPQGISNAYA
jgi:hypothetical protein